MVFTYREFALLSLFVSSMVAIFLLMSQNYRTAGMVYTAISLLVALFIFGGVFKFFRK